MNNEAKENRSPSLSRDRKSCFASPSNRQGKERETISVQRKASNYGKKRKNRKKSPSLSLSDSDSSNGSSLSSLHKKRERNSAQRNSIKINQRGQRKAETGEKKSVAQKMRFSQRVNRRKVSLGLIRTVRTHKIGKIKA